MQQRIVLVPVGIILFTRALHRSCVVIVGDTEMSVARQRDNQQRKSLIIVSKKKSPKEKEKKGLKTVFSEAGHFGVRVLSFLSQYGGSRVQVPVLLPPTTIKKETLVAVVVVLLILALDLQSFKDYGLAYFPFKSFSGWVW